MNTFNIGKFICELRKENGITQKELAEKLNITDKAISKWETGRSAPDISLLTPLAKVLGVSVAEILQGRKITNESLPETTDKLLVRTIKNYNKKLKNTIFITIIIMLTLILIATLSYPSYHFFNSVPIDNESAILKQSNVSDKIGEDTKIVKTVKKGDFYFYLLKCENNVILSIFEKDKIFKNRITFWGGSSCNKANEISQYCSGMGYVTMNVFFGYDMIDTEYNYNYRGVKCTKAIDDKFVLDVLIDINDSFTNADIIYDK